MLQYSFIMKWSGKVVCTDFNHPLVVVFDKNTNNKICSFVTMRGVLLIELRCLDNLSFYLHKSCGDLTHDKDTKFTVEALKSRHVSQQDLSDIL